VTWWPARRNAQALHKPMMPPPMMMIFKPGRSAG